MPSLPTKGSTVTLNTCASTCCAGSGAACIGSASAPSPRRKSGGLPSVGLRQQLDDDVEQLGHAGAAARRDEAHRDQVAFAQRLLQRRVQLGWRRRRRRSGSGRRSRRRPRPPARPARGAPLRRCRSRLCPSRLKKQSTTLRAAGGGQVQRQALLAEGGLDLRQQRRQVDARRVDLVDDDQAVEMALRRRSPSCAAPSARCRSAALMTTAAVSTASSAGSDWPRKSARARRVDEVDARAGVRQVQHAGVERMLHAPLQRVVVADGGAALQLPGAPMARRGAAGLRPGWSCRRPPARPGPACVSCDVGAGA